MATCAVSAQIDGPVTAVEPVEPADGTAEDDDEEGAARAAEDAAEGEDEERWTNLNALEESFVELNHSHVDHFVGPALPTVA